MKPRLFLHVGQHKTGTTSIQGYLKHHEETLRAHGFWQPDRLGRPDGGFQRVGELIVTEGPEAFVAHLKRGHDGGAIIVSAENLCRVLTRTHPEANAVITAHFDTTVILSMRRQDEMLESAFSQMVKFGRRLNIEKDDPYPFDYEPMVGRLVQDYGRDNVKLSLYGADRSLSPEAMLMRVVGGPELPPLERQANVRTHRRNLLFMSQLELKRRSISNKLLAFLQDNPVIRDDGIRELSSVARRNALIAEHRDGNTRICEAFGLDADFMTAPVRDDGWFPARKISSREWADVMSGFLQPRHLGV
ncbi:hypothetical protein [uncultured Mameliella sp.]|uniref:hypothetical protein n=1 Tax=uncultured Mameliella sp. TaxID=1447087 RepID=UPI00263395BF|nr:hypothetical protein [uncultured Mameliella sp.]